MIKKLSESDLFFGIDDSDIDDVVTKYGEILEFNKGEYIFRKEEKPDYMFILLDGEVTVFSEDINGKRELLSSFDEAGVLFAEVYLYLEKRKYHFYAVADKKTKLLGISKDFFSNLLDDNSKIGKIIMENYLTTLSEKLYYFNQKIRIMSGFTLRQKLSRFIIENRNDSMEFELKYNREKLADYLGATRPSVSRELNKMQKEGIIEITRSDIKILNLKELNLSY